MSSKIKSFLKFTDMLSKSPSLKVNEKSSYRTYFGGIISIIIIILTIGSIGYFGKDLISKKDPIAIVSAYEFDSIGFNISPNDYYLLFAVEDSNFSYYNDPTIFTFRAYHQTILLNSDGNTTVTTNDFEIKPCIDYFPNSTLKEGLNKEIFFCLKPDQYKTEGYWGHQINSYVGIFLEKCVNTTINNNHCKSENEIDSKVNGGVLSMYSLNSNLNLKNFDEPIKIDYDNIFYSLNSEFTFTLFIQLRKLEIITDHGFILEQFSDMNKYYIDKPHLLYYGKRGSIISDIVIQNKPMGQKINRTYIKFQDFLTKMGGLIKALIVIGSFMIKFTSDAEYYNNYIYNITTKRRNKDSSLINQNQLNSYISNNFLNTKTMTKNTKNQIKINNNKNIKHMTNVYNQLSFKNSIYDFIIQLCICNNSHIIKKFKRSIENKINKALSIEVILEKSYIVEALSLMTLNEKQMISIEEDFNERILNDVEKRKDDISNRVFYINRKSFFSNINM